MDFNNSKFSSNLNEKNNSNELENNDKEINKEVEKYVDIEGLSTKKLNFGFWYVKNRKKIKGIIVIILMTIASISWLYTIYNFIYYYAIGIKNDERMTTEMVSSGILNHSYFENTSPKDMKISSPEFFRNSSGSYDVFVQVQNPNEKHYGIFKYCFVSREETIECKDDFILPNDSKYIMSLTNKSEAGMQNIDFRISDFSWKRINPHQFPNWENFKNERISFSISNVKFNTAGASGLSEKIDLNTLEFTIKNNTAFNYWAVPLNIVLYSGVSIVGVNQYIVQEFMSKESRDITLSWPGNLGRINDVQVKAELNILKDDIYIKYEGGTEITR